MKNIVKIKAANSSKSATSVEIARTEIDRVSITPYQHEGKGDIHAILNFEVVDDEDEPKLVATIGAGAFRYVHLVDEDDKTVGAVLETSSDGQYFELPTKPCTIWSTPTGKPSRFDATKPELIAYISGWTKADFKLVNDEKVIKKVEKQLARGLEQPAVAA